MTYIELYEKATRQLEKSEITLGEYEEIVEQLDREIITTCKDCCNVNCSYHEQMCDPEEYRPNFYCADAVRRI